MGSGFMYYIYEHPLISAHYWQDVTNHIAYPESLQVPLSIQALEKPGQQSPILSYFYPAWPEQADVFVANSPFISAPEVFLSPNHTR